MRLKRTNKERGFSLIEVLITILILTVVMVVMLSTFIYGFNLLSRMKQSGIATQIVQEELEIIRNMPFDDIINLSSEFTHENFSFLKNASGTISIGDSEGADIKKLTVSVIWTYRGVQLQRDIVTFITREGINRK
jgi:prepilin-type N-terminal cleavage/methylation domain-containing protein